MKLPRNANQIGPVGAGELNFITARVGDATHEARVQDFLRAGDEATRTTVLSRLDASYAVRGEPVDLDGLWRALGVEVGRGGAVTLLDDAPLASIRKAIASGTRH